MWRSLELPRGKKQKTLNLRLFKIFYTETLKIRLELTTHSSFYLLTAAIWSFELLTSRLWQDISDSKKLIKNFYWPGTSNNIREVCLCHPVHAVNILPRKPIFLHQCKKLQRLLNHSITWLLTLLDRYQCSNSSTNTHTLI